MYDKIIWVNAKQHGIDFLTLEEVREDHSLILRAPYMTKDFIKAIEQSRPAVVYIKYQVLLIPFQEQP